jgi:hypothetical protein
MAYFFFFFKLNPHNIQDEVKIRKLCSWSVIWLITLFPPALRLCYPHVATEYVNVAGSNWNVLHI